MINILIADDHNMFADGIESILTNESDITVIGKTPSGEGVFEILSKQVPDIVLLDINLADTNGVEVAKQLNTDYPSVKILAISMFKEESFISEMLKQGTDGYLLKNTDKKELLKAIYTIYEGQSYFSKEVTKVIMQSLKSGRNKAGSIIKKNPKISRREQEVLALIAKEFTTKEIAHELFISLKTVESHRSNLLAKFDVRNSVGLVRIAMENGLI